MNDQVATTLEEEGIAAFHADTPRDACPYPDPWLREPWLYGWDAGWLVSADQPQKL